jgi:hypothetical protein
MHLARLVHDPVLRSVMKPKKRYLFVEVVLQVSRWYKQEAGITRAIRIGSQVRHEPHNGLAFGEAARNTNYVDYYR